MELKDLRHIFFIGIGGIGMSAIARYFVKKGVAVTGYDKTETALTRTLASEGISVHYTDDVTLIPKDIDLVVYTPAIPRNQSQLVYCMSNKDAVPVMKRSQVLGWISQHADAIGVAGTHGKTTTSAILAHIMKYSGEDVSAFVGGIMADYDSNYFAGTSDWVVLEADEYDRSFLQLSPEITILQSMDADHLDIYGDEAQLKCSFIEFVNRTSYGGAVIMPSKLKDQLGVHTIANMRSEFKLIFYGAEDANAVISNIRVVSGMTMWNLQYLGVNYELTQFLPGIHNIHNATAAFIAGIEAGCDVEGMTEALAVFKGVKRRFERIVQRDVVYIDDYAHHPAELRAAIEAARSLYDGRLVGIFQPHLYSRTRDFADGFAASCDLLDEAILMDIYPAREMPIKGVSSKMILDRMSNEHKHLMTNEEILEWVKKKEFDVLMTLGAGDIDLLVSPIKAALT